MLSKGMYRINYTKLIYSAQLKRVLDTCTFLAFKSMVRYQDNLMKTSKSIHFAISILFSVSVHAEIMGNEKDLINKVNTNFGIPGMETSWYADIKSISS
jgi:hypothetical protein